MKGQGPSTNHTTNNRLHDSLSPSLSLPSVSPHSLTPPPSLSLPRLSPSLSLSPLPLSLHLSSHHSLSLPLPFTDRPETRETQNNVKLANKHTNINNIVQVMFSYVVKLALFRSKIDFLLPTKRGVKFTHAERLARATPKSCTGFGLLD